MPDEGTEGKMVSDYLRTQQFTRSVNMYGYYYNYNLKLSYLYVGIRQTVWALWVPFGSSGTLQLYRRSLAVWRPIAIRAL